jgi:hypothetical protein
MACNYIHFFILICIETIKGRGYHDKPEGVALIIITIPSASALDFRMLFFDDVLF